MKDIIELESKIKFNIDLKKCTEEQCNENYLKNLLKKTYKLNTEEITLNVGGCVMKIPKDLMDKFQTFLIEELLFNLIVHNYY